MIEHTARTIHVQVVETTTYSFPDPDARCPAHGNQYCVSCARNPSTCATPDGSCGFYASTGMHWDTCPNRIR